MSNKITGVVEGIKDFTTAAGKTMYSVKLGGVFYGFGGYAPKCSVGDSVSFDATANGKYWNAESKTLEILGKATPATIAQAARSDANDPRQKTIARQSALNSAIAFINICASLEAIPGLTKTMKTEDRYQLLDALVMEKVAEYYLTSTGTFYEPVEGSEAPSAGEAKVAGWK